MSSFWGQHHYLRRFLLAIRIISDLLSSPYLAFSSTKFMDSPKFSSPFEACYSAAIIKLDFHLCFCFSPYYENWVSRSYVLPSFEEIIDSLFLSSFEALVIFEHTTVPLKSLPPSLMSKPCLTLSANVVAGASSVSSLCRCPLLRSSSLLIGFPRCDELIKSLSHKVNIY